MYLAEEWTQSRAMQLDHVKPSLSRESLDWEVTILIVVDY